MKSIRAVLFDLDGTLVQSNDAHAQAWVTALAEAGHDVPFVKVRQMIGMGGDKLLPRVSGIDAESSLGKRISKRRAAIFLERYLPSLRPTPGAQDLLGELAERGLTLSIASSAKSEELQHLMKICGADQYVTSSTSSDDAENSKPDPDILQAALQDLDLSADEAVLIGDTPYDVEAAKRIGLRVIGLRCGGWSDVDLAADAIYDDPAHLLRKLDESLIRVFREPGVVR